MIRPMRAAVLAALVLFGAAGGMTDRTARGASVPLAHGAPSVADVPSLSVMTYNIKGLPWPVAWGREDALDRIADRLALLRRTGKGPQVVVLQEAFTGRAMRLARRAGYAHAVFGPDPMLANPTPATRDDAAYLADARWDRGEGAGKLTGSGLVLLSDHPVVGVDMMSFPDFACAGFDCLANKGVMIAHLRLPDGTMASVVNTHLNANKASGVGRPRALHAFARQADLMAGFIARHVPAGRPLVIAGDMNVGRYPDRQQAFFAPFARHAGLGFVAPGRAVAAVALRGAADLMPEHRDELATLAGNGKDWIFARGARVDRATVPFGEEADGPPLSDHYGHMATLRLSDAPHMAQAGQGGMAGGMN